MSRPKLHFNRRRRFLRDSLILFLSLLLLYICLDFPIPTADLARRATERRAFFGPSQVLCTLEEPLSWDRSYAVRWQDWYGVVSIPRNGLFWDTGSVDVVENAPSQALVPMTDQVMLFQNTPIVVFSNDPNIVRVALEFPAAPGGGNPRLVSAVAWSDNGCFVLGIPDLPMDTTWTYSRDFRLAGYDASVNRIWFTENPESWVEQFGVEFA